MEVVAIDAYDWVMVGNIWAMGYYYNGAMTRPYISGANYIVKMSNYERDGVWDVAWDAMFHRFVEKHRVPFYWRGARGPSGSK
jgi:deoxyribodipyrimidine photolyase-related protein